MLLKVELDQVLVAAEVAVVHGVRLPVHVGLDLLARPQRGNGVDKGPHPLVVRLEVKVDG